MYYICILTLLQWIVPSFSHVELSDSKIPVHKHGVAQECLYLLLLGVSNQAMMAPNFTLVMVALKNTEKSQLWQLSFISSHCTAPRIHTLWWLEREKTKLIILNLSAKAIAPFAALFQVQCQLLWAVTLQGVQWFM